MASDFDLRKHPRISPVVIRAEYETGGISGEGYLLNVSRGGAFLATEDLLRIDDPVSLEISLPWNLGKIRTEAKVVWRSDTIPADREVPTGVGVVFTQIKPEECEKLQRYIEEFTRLAALIE